MAAFSHLDNLSMSHETEHKNWMHVLNVRYLPSFLLATPN